MSAPAASWTRFAAHGGQCVLGASGQLGYGIPTPAFNAGLARQPDLIGCDMDSIDIGRPISARARWRLAGGDAARSAQGIARGASIDVRW